MSLRLPADPLLLTTTRVLTFYGGQALTNATGFFLEREGALYLVTSRHVLVDADQGHFPDRIDIELHTDADNLASAAPLSIALYRDGTAVWHEGMDTSGAVDMAVIRLDRAALPPGTVFTAFTPAHLPGPDTRVDIGAPLLIVGFPLGFHDTLHHMPVARRATVASAFGLRFGGLGYFLTDARTHRGTSGAPVVMADPQAGNVLPWRLLGVHSSRLDSTARDLEADEALGLNVAWYADMLLTLTR